MNAGLGNMPAGAGAPALPRYAGAVATIAVLVTILVFYRAVATEIVGIWERSETFAHGYLVPPVSLWLAWRARGNLAGVPVRPSWIGVVLLALSGLLWFLSDLAGVAVGTHFALAFMLIAGVIAIAGTAVARRLAFPLGFLLFGVPFGEFMVPWLIERTADFTVAALRVTGIPVFREGTDFVIPSGSWSVVEACSGIRYLIASLFGGTLFAYLYCRSLRRRLLIVAAALLVPLVANWMRAYLIVMIGHLSSNKLATGVDHLIYGWLFFGIVMFIFFTIAARFREDGDAEPVPVNTAASLPRSSPLGSLIGVVVGALIAAGVWMPLDTWLESRSSAQEVRLDLVEGLGNWRAQAEPAVTWKPEYAGPSRDRFTAYASGDDVVGVYVAYYRRQRQGSELVSSENVIVQRSDRNWRTMTNGTARVPWGAGTVEARATSLRGASTLLRVRHWYWINGSYTNDDRIAKLSLAWAKLTGRGDDSALITIYSPYVQSPAAADAALDRFGAEMGAAIAASLGRAAAH